MSLAPQTSTNANGNGAVLQVEVGSPSGSGGEGYLELTRLGTVFGVLGGLPAQFSIGTLWLGLNGALRDNTNFTIATQPSGQNTYINAPGTGQFYFSIGGPANFVNAGANGSGWQFFNGETFGLGGGSGVMGLAPATTLPTTAVTGVVLAVDSNGLGFWQGSSPIRTATIGLVGSSGTIWLTEGTLSSSNYALQSDGANTGISGTTSVRLQVAGASKGLILATEARLIGNLQVGSLGTGDYGGGVGGILSLALASSMPTTAPTGSFVFANDGAGFHAYAGGGSYFDDYRFLPAANGTRNTQQNARYLFKADARTANSNVQAITVPLTTGQTVAIYVTAVARSTTGTVGATASTQTCYVIKNIGGTLSGAAGNPASGTINVTDTTMTAATLSCTVVTFTGAVTVQVTSNSSTGTIDWTVWADCYYS